MDRTNPPVGSLLEQAASIVRRSKEAAGTFEPAESYKRGQIEELISFANSNSLWIDFNNISTIYLDKGGENEAACFWKRCYVFLEKMQRLSRKDAASVKTHGIVVCFHPFHRTTTSFANHPYPSTPLYSSALEGGRGICRPLHQAELQKNGYSQKNKKQVCESPPSTL